MSRLRAQKISRRSPVGAPGWRVGWPILRCATAATYPDARTNWRAPTFTSRDTRNIPMPGERPEKIDAREFGHRNVLSPGQWRFPDAGRARPPPYRARRPGPVDTPRLWRAGRSARRSLGPFGQRPLLQRALSAAAPVRIGPPGD